MFFKKLVVYTICSTFLLSGCVSTGGANAGFNIGPLFSSVSSKKQDEEKGINRPKLDVIIPVFNPGLPENPKDYAIEGVWPELRRAEANRFAYKLKKALDETEAFGAVRVTPDKTATGDIYVLGKIEESNGEDVEFDLEVFDISGKRWFSKSFDHEVDEAFHRNIRNRGKDPYQPIFKEAADYLVEELDDVGAKELTVLKSITDLRFGANFSEEVFAGHLKLDNGHFVLASLPSNNDPMLRRVKSIRVRDQLFVDRLQSSYEMFDDKMETSYLIWQEQALQETKAERKAKIKAVGEAFLGILAITAAVAAATYSAKSDNYGGSTAGATGAVVAGAAGVALLQKSFQTSEEAKVHREALEELGQSLDVELAPQVVEFEEKTEKLTGDAKEQFAQWRTFLKKIYEHEATPDVKL